MAPISLGIIPLKKLLAVMEISNQTERKRDEFSLHQSIRYTVAREFCV